MKKTSFVALSNIVFAAKNNWSGYGPIMSNYPELRIPQSSRFEVELDGKNAKVIFKERVHPIDYSEIGELLLSHDVTIIKLLWEKEGGQRVFVENHGWQGH
ncbi:MAG TPA: hypothetical protein PK950_02080 [Candidatus Paceibacterota bacterium]|nr:hypothetical protein [Candidatus Paceibacterota bacterium]